MSRLVLILGLLLGALLFPPIATKTMDWINGNQQLASMLVLPALIAMPIIIFLWLEFEENLKPNEQLLTSI
jgi:hypothetical protein